MCWSGWFLQAWLPVRLSPACPPIEPPSTPSGDKPTDPHSDIIFTVTLELTAVAKDGSEVAWEIVSVMFSQPGVEIDNVWIEYAPDPDTPDGYWWVEHADPDVPQEAEFDWPPNMFGTAIAVAPVEDDLHYDFGGDYCDSQCQQLYGGQVAAADYWFLVEDEEEPEAEGDDEPVEISGETIYG